MDEGRTHNYWTVFAISFVTGLYACRGMLACCNGIIQTVAIVEIVPALIYPDLFEPYPEELSPAPSTFEA